MLQARTLDAIRERMSVGHDEEAAAGIQKLLKRVESEYDEIRKWKGEEIVRITAEYSRDKRILLLPQVRYTANSMTG